MSYMFQYLIRRCPETGRNFTRDELYDAMGRRGMYSCCRSQKVSFDFTRCWDCDVFSLGWFEFGIHTDRRGAVTGVVLMVSNSGYYDAMRRRWFMVSPDDFLDCLRELGQMEERIRAMLPIVPKILPSRVRIMQRNRLIEEIRSVRRMHE